MEEKLKYIIVRGHTDFEPMLQVVGTFFSRKNAIRECKNLPPGTYSLLSVLRPGFEVVAGERVSYNVVKWGSTMQPRPRRPKVKDEPLNTNEKEQDNV